MNKFLLALGLTLIFSSVLANTFYALPKPAKVAEFRKTAMCPQTGKIEPVCFNYIVTYKVHPTCGGKETLNNYMYKEITTTPTKGCKYVKK